MKTLPAIFQAITGSHEEYYMDGPFSVGKHVYATNNTIIVRAVADTVLAASFAKKEPVPPVETLNWSRSFYADRGIYFTLPGKQIVSCACRCGGFCAANPSCDQCFGTGKVDTYPDFQIGDDRYVWEYIALLGKHNVVEGYPAIERPSEQKAPVYFIGDGFDGILMNRKPK